MSLEAESSTQQQSEPVKCESDDGGEAKKRRLQVGIGQFVCKTSSETKAQLDLAISDSSMAAIFLLQLRNMNYSRTR